MGEKGLLNEIFDPEGSGYDYGHPGVKKGKNNHYPSLLPIGEGTGLVLKGRKHKTWNLMEEVETELGNKIIKKGNRYYSVPDRRKEEE